MKTRFILTIILPFFFLCTGVQPIAAQQTIQVKGLVSDHTTHQIIPGTSIRIKNTTQGTASDINGRYQLEARTGDTLIFSFVGYQTEEVLVRQNIHNIRMSPDTCSLAECTVVSYGCPVTSFKRAYPRPLQKNTEEYHHFKANTYLSPFRHPLSTLSIDIDAASYANMRRFINSGSLPPANAIRSEELINYFNYNYPVPTGQHPLGITAEVSECPWNPSHRLVHIGLRAKDADRKNLPSSNLVFLIDVSGSMASANKLPLLKSSLKLLVSQLRDNDKVSIVTYAGETNLTLTSVSGKEKVRILHAIDQLKAEGVTAGGAGIQEAYRIARTNFIPRGNNRIILATDGDFNVGVSSEEELKALILKERKSSVYLTVLGFGMGNYKDNRLQVLAQTGNGNHAYIDNLSEARKVLVSEFSGSMYTVAKDVKLQVEFNPAQVESYRLIGYESRLLEDADFNDDTKDAGEIGVGHTVTALYEIIPPGTNQTVDPLKYQPNPRDKKLNNSPELFTVKLRYKNPESEKSQKLELAVEDKKIPLSLSSENFRFSAAVAAFGMFLTESDYLNGYNCRQISALAREAVGNDPEGYRKEFIRLVETAGLLE